MARARSRKPRNPNHEAKLRALIRAGKRVDPSNRRATARAFSELKRKDTLEKHYGHDVTRERAKELKKHGFYVNLRKRKPLVVVDVPRNVHREKIPHTKFSVLKGGIVQFKNTERRDFIIGFTNDERKQFADSPGDFVKRKVAEFKSDHPQYARYIKPSSIRLQWGAFQGTKQFAPSYFTKSYFSTISPEEAREVPARKRKPRIDKLTGIHITIFVPAKSKGKHASKEKARGRKRKNRKS